MLEPRTLSPTEQAAADLIISRTLRVLAAMTWVASIVTVLDEQLLAACLVGLIAITLWVAAGARR